MIFKSNTISPNPENLLQGCLPAYPKTVIEVTRSILKDALCIVCVKKDSEEHSVYKMKAGQYVLLVKSDSAYVSDRMERIEIITAINKYKIDPSKCA